MTDLEITRLCAEAMHEDKWGEHKGRIAYPDYSAVDVNETGPTMHTYDPLHDDAQAMALVKKMGLHIEPEDQHWTVAPAESDAWSESVDLNRAICKCVAKMQAAKGAK